MRRCKIGSGRSFASSCAAPPTGEEVVSSADEAPGNFCSEDNSPVCSPTSSWRGSNRSSSNGSWRDSPSQRSQDSGYSDSGESNAGCQNEIDEGLNQPPQVRHITRIYFGDCSHPQASTCDKSNNTDENEFSTPFVPFVPKTSYSATPKTVKIGKKRNCTIVNTISPNSLVNNIQTSKSLDRIPANTSAKLQSSPTTNLSDLEEKDDTQLEHKSLRNSSFTLCTPQSNFSTKKLSKNIIKSIFNDQRLCHSQANGASEVTPFSAVKTSSRNYRKISQGKRSTPKRSKSNEKLLEDSEDVSTKPRRQEPLKARRRWSSSDLDRCSSKDANLSSGSKNVENLHNATFPLQNQNSPTILKASLPRLSPFDVAEKIR